MKENINKVAAALRKLQEPDGSLDPNVVWRAAKSKSSVLHRYFTWDIKKAAAERWVQQARDLIRRVEVHIIVHKKSIRVPLYVRDTLKPSDELGYRSTVSLLDDVAATKQTLEYAAKTAEGHLLRYKHLAITLGVERSFNAAVAAIKTLEGEARRRVK